MICRVCFIILLPIHTYTDVKTLVKKGSRVAQRDWLGHNSIFYAVKNNNPVILEALLQGSEERLNPNEQFTVSLLSKG